MENGCLTCTHVTYDFTDLHITFGESKLGFE